MCGIIISKMNYFDRARYFRTKKRLGQNFLVDGEVIQDIIEFANISPDDTIVEIGPGVGFVTEQLVKYAKKVIVIELDEEAIEELKKRVALRGIGTANVWVVSISSETETYTRGYGKLNSLTLDSGKLKDSCKKDSLVNIIKVAKVIKKYGK